MTRHEQHHDDPHATRDTPGATHDPVCNHWVIPRLAHGTTTHQGVTIHFCSDACKRAFDSTPERFFPRHQRRPEEA